MAARSNSKTWEKRTEVYRNSGLMAVNWCMKNNLKISTFKYWVTKLNKEKNKQEQEWIAIENPVNPSLYS